MKAGRVTDEERARFEDTIVTLRSNRIKQFDAVLDQINLIVGGPLAKEERDYLDTPDGIEDYLYNKSIPFILEHFAEVDLGEVNDLEIKQNVILKFELFTRVFNRWLIDKAQKPVKTETNDLIDVLNMVYIGSSDKYWTKETRWIDRVKRAGLEHYLFDSNSIKS